MAQSNFKSPARMGSLGDGATAAPAGSVPGSAGKGPGPKGADFERRSFLGMVVGGVGAAVAVSTLYPIVRFIVPPVTVVKEVNELVVGKASDVPLKGFKIYQFNKDKVLVVNDNGKLTACSAVCTHLGCLVRWESAQNLIFCPCHGAKYKQTGEIISGPQPKPLIAYKVRVEGEDLIVSKA
ncbi:MAG: Rieske 2Fe-2S domain-containing protein [Chlorobiaceae bacterium]|nr:Rieske 2Fe-2S domain-containing protein [Chlorobiaceae bacterium]NTV60182.1 Rieske 2Fe-2S domain-containing protein [Chlorobiaceae bacterium]